MLRVAVTVEQSWQRVPGGTARSILELVRATAATRAVDVVGVSALHRRPPPEAWVPPVPVRHLPLPTPLLYETWHLRSRRFPNVEWATGPVDVVHATANAYPASRAPVVVTIHDLAFLDDPSFATRHGLRFFRRGAALAREHAHLVVCPSGTTRQECLAVGFEPERVRVVPWGVDVRPVDAAAVEAVRAKHGLSRRYVLFCGTVEPRKNLRALLAAFARLPQDDVDLVLAGPAGWNEDITGAVARLGSRAHRLGFLPRAELDALYAGAAVMCYPSRREGFGLPVLEAMAQGAPVVTSRGTATEEVAGDAAVLVDPNDIDAIASGLDDVLSDEGFAADLAARGRARAATFTWAATAAAYIDIYREAARA